MSKLKVQSQVMAQVEQEKDEKSKVEIGTARSTKPAHVGGKKKNRAEGDRERLLGGGHEKAPISLSPPLFRKSRKERERKSYLGGLTLSGIR